MANNKINFLFITANVGSIFQDPKGLLKPWICEFMKIVTRLKPKFIALHCQEFGGKNYKKSHIFVDNFIRTLITSQEMFDYHSIRVFLDEDFVSEDKFTALGSFYFIHKTQEAFIWNFHCNSFVPITEKEIHSGSIESVPTKYKVKFPQEFFPECKWSRKGFMRTRWLINGTIFDTINIHLFHDESNFISISEFPSIYAKNRRKALEFTLNSIEKDGLKDLPLFIFGDFNFRLDISKVIQRMTIDSKLSQKKNKNGELSRLLYQDHRDNSRILSIEKKQFVYPDQKFFTDPNNQEWLLEQDKELNHFEGILNEWPKSFLPSYPFEENVHSSSSRYMNTRCPSWCDRVLMNNAAKILLNKDNHEDKIQYDILGMHSPMGDHKPVYLYFELNCPSEKMNGSIVQNRQCVNEMINNNKSSTPINNKIVPPIASSSSSLASPQTSSASSSSSTTIKNYFYYNQVSSNLSMQSSTSTSSTAINLNNIQTPVATGADTVIINRVYVFKETQI